MVSWGTCQDGFDDVHSISCFVQVAIFVVVVGFEIDLHNTGKHVTLSAVISRSELLLKTVNACVNIFKNYHGSGNYRNTFNTLCTMGTYFLSHYNLNVFHGGGLKKHVVVYFSFFWSTVLITNNMNRLKQFRRNCGHRIV